MSFGEDVVAGRSANAERGILGLRLADGLDRAATQHLRRDDATRAALEWGKANDLLAERTTGSGAPRLALTMQGRLLADELFVRMI